jgi:CRP-like cAMP-binding protein
MRKKDVSAMAIDGMVYGFIVDEQEFPHKAVIIEEETVGDWVYVILEGKVKVKKKTAKGNITIASLTEGAVFGEVPLLEKTNRMRTASFVADGPVRVGVLDAERLERELENLSPTLRGLIRTLAKRLSETIGKISLAMSE